MVSGLPMKALKKQIRRAVLQRLQRVSPAEITSQSEALSQTIIASDHWKRAQTVALFYSMPHEIQTHLLIKQAFAEGKRVYLPRAYRLDHMTMWEVLNLDEIDTFPMNFWGIREPHCDHRHNPMSTGDLDVVYIPGLAFDSSCNRLGYGKGYYDRWLEDWQRCLFRMPTIVGICLKEQVLDSVPVDDHDIKCHRVIYCKD